MRFLTNFLLVLFVSLGAIQANAGDGIYNMEITRVRVNPDYIFKIHHTNKRRIKCWVGFICGGSDLDVKGYPTKDNLGDRIDVYQNVGGRLDNEAIDRFVDELHAANRKGQDEKEWDKQDEAELQAILEKALAAKQAQDKAQSDAETAAMIEKLKEEFRKKKAADKALGK